MLKRTGTGIAVVITFVVGVAIGVDINNKFINLKDVQEESALSAAKNGGYDDHPASRFNILTGTNRSVMDELAGLSQDLLYARQASTVRKLELETVVSEVENRLGEILLEKESMDSRVMPVSRAVVKQIPLAGETIDSSERVALTIDVAAQQSGLDPSEIQAMLQ